MTIALDPLAIADQLARLARDLRTLETRIGGFHRRSREGVRTGAPGSTVPALSGISVTQRADAFAYFHARCLIEESSAPFRPRGMGTPAILEALRDHVGFWTEHADQRLALDFADELAEVTAVVRDELEPRALAWVEVGGECSVDGCGGRYRVQVDRDSDLRDDWHPRAECWRRTDHGDRLTPGHDVDAVELAAYLSHAA